MTTDAARTINKERKMVLQFFLYYTLAHVLESFFRVPAILITTLNLFGEQIRMYTTILNENEIKESCELL